MKSTFMIIKSFIILSVLLCSTITIAGGKDTIVISEVGFSTPESVEYYSAEDVYLVSNINGDPFAEDDNGFISKLKPDGSVIELKWIDGAKQGITLNSPKGLAISNGRLFAVDGNKVHMFELPSGKQQKSISIKESTFLNGITPGPDGSVFVTDSGYEKGFTPSGTDAIYQIWANGNYKVIVKDEKLGHPNGIWDDNGDLIVNTFGTGKLFGVSNSGKLTPMPTPPSGELDGLIKLKDGRLIVSSWSGSSVYTMDTNGKFVELINTLDAPADLGLDTKRNRLLIPLFKQNKVFILPL